MFWYICEDGGRKNMEKVADGSKGGVRGDVSLELFSWSLHPLSVGSRVGWQVPSAVWVIQEGSLPLACLFVTQPRSAHIFSQALVISPSLPLAGQSYFPRKSEMKYHLLGQRPSLKVSVTSVGDGLCCSFSGGRTSVPWPVHNLAGGESRKQGLCELSPRIC